MLEQLRINSDSEDVPPRVTFGYIDDIRNTNSSSDQYGRPFD